MSAERLQERMSAVACSFANGNLNLQKSRVPAPPRREPGHPQVQIVVVEEGALIGALQPPAELDQTAVVAQMRGETALQLVQRAIHRIASTQRSGANVAQVSLYLAPDFDQQTMAARRLLGSAVLASATFARRPCELVLVERWQEGHLRRQLWELVETLVTEPGSASVPIRLRFQGPNALS